MLPNWLYGKSKSKLASILGGGGGTPSDYNQVKAQVAQNTEDIAQNTEDILSLSDALDGKVAKTQIINPNILHNPWFQVNQRGLATMNTNGLWLDRWRTVCAATGSSTYTLNSDGTITIDNSLGEAHCYLVQRRTSKTIEQLTGKVITVSIMLSDGTIRSGSGTYVATETKNYYEDGDIKIQSIAQSLGQFFVLRVEAGKTITIKALKFEIGPISTLAMDTAPDMATELLKCQRYFQRIENTGNIPQFLTLGLAQGASYIRGNIYYNQTRVVPAVSVTGKCYAGLQGATDTLIEIAKINAVIGNNLSYIVYSGSDLTDKQVYNIFLDVGAYIDIDAEL